MSDRDDTNIIAGLNNLLGVGRGNGSATGDEYLFVNISIEIIRATPRDETYISLKIPEGGIVVCPDV